MGVNLFYLGNESTIELPTYSKIKAKKSTKST